MSATEAKICLLGDSGVGKSSIVSRFVHNTFNAANESTIGASFMTKTFIWNQNNYKFNIWDTAGQERYRALAPMYYRQAVACVVVYDVTERESFLALQSWLKELQTHLSRDKCLLAIAGNKCDLERAVPTNEARELANSIGAIFVETSAKSAQNVNQLFCAIAQRLPKEEEKSLHSGLELKANLESETKGRKCC